MQRRYDSDYEDKESFSPWETYSDLYCGLLLVFVLLFFFAIYQYIDAREKNNAETAALQEEMREEQTTVLALYEVEMENQEAAYQEKLKELENQELALSILLADLENQKITLNDQCQVIDDQKEQLGSQESQLTEQQSLLAEQQSKLDAQQNELNEQQSKLDAQALVLTEQEMKLSEQELKLAQQQSKLDEQQSLLTQQQTRLDEQQALLDNQAVQIEQIVGVRGQLIDELNSELTANSIQIQADRTTGAIAVESTVLFATDSNVLREEGLAFFEKFMPVYLSVLLQPEFQDYIAEIIIEGHTDDTGSYLHNLELSQQRAWSVAEYFFGENCDFLSEETKATLKSLLTVNGCADKNPIYKEDGTIDGDKSRRVEIKFRLKDQEMIQEMDEILNK